VYRFVRARVDNVATAEDVTSAAFEDVLAGLPRYREQGRFGAWLFTIVRHHLQDLYRDRARATSGTAPQVTAAEDDLPPEDLHVLRAAMAQLTADRREALELRFFAGLRVREVADAMGKGESAVKMLIHRGLAQLRQTLAEADDV